MTQLESARKGLVTPEVVRAAAEEGIAPERLRDLLVRGRAVVPKNVNHHPERIFAVGEGLTTKVNANIGTSGECTSIEGEIEKLRVAVEAGAHSVMDLSTGGDLSAIRAEILGRSPVMVGAVPIYGVATECLREGTPLDRMDPDALLRSIESQCAAGLDYITVHCGVTQECLKRVDASSRLLPSVSRGGSILMNWMRKNHAENPLYEHFDAVCEIAHRHDVVLSLGDGFRPGSVVDATDGPQLQELILLGELARRAREKGVQCIIEGPGHVPLNQVVANVQIEKQLCDGAPFYLLGPLVTDIAPGYDHITAAIGGALAAMAGADFLCYVTPAEHLSIPDANDVREGVVASLIAAHAADVAKGIPGAIERDRRMSVARRDLDWEGMLACAVNPAAARAKMKISKNQETCTMCGELCAVKLSRK